MLEFKKKIGLMQGVMAQSGVATSFWSIDKNPLESAQLMAQRLECPDTSSSTAIVSCLREIS